MEYLFDTSWIIEVLAGRGETARQHKRLNLAKIAVSYVSIGEIYEVAFNLIMVNPRLCRGTPKV